MRIRLIEAAFSFLFALFGSGHQSTQQKRAWVDEGITELIAPNALALGDVRPDAEPMFGPRTTSRLMRRAVEGNATVHESFDGNAGRSVGSVPLKRFGYAQSSGDEDIWTTLNATLENGRDLSSLVACVPEPDGGQALVTSSGFAAQIQRGVSSVTSKTVIFAGLMRDVGDSVATLFGALHTVGSAFARYQIVVVENDSNDEKTRVGLAQECQTKQTWCFMLQWPELSKRQDQGMKDRIMHLTRLRESLLEQVLRFVSMSRQSWDFLVQFDGDIFAKSSMGFSPGAMFAMLGSSPGTGEPALAEKPFTLVCANQLSDALSTRPGRYRDTFALRVGDWDETKDPPKDQTYYRGDALVRVKSCFSGLAIYSMDAIVRSGCHYQYVNESTCEHVVFNQCLDKSGFSQVAIYPPLAVFIAELGHASTAQVCTHWSNNPTERFSPEALKQIEASRTQLPQ